MTKNIPKSGIFLLFFPVLVYYIYMTNERYSNISPINEGPNYQNFNLDELKDVKGPITYNEYLKLQERIILGEENREKTTSSLGHEPTRNELANYFVESGQAAEFHKKYFHRIIPTKAS